MSYGIAVGYNQIPTELHLLNPPLFENFELGVDDDWIQPQARSGDGKLNLIGRPVVRWTLAAITQAEWDFLRTNIFMTQTIEATIDTPDRSAATHPTTRYNVLGAFIDLSGGHRQSYRGGLYYDVVLEFTQLDAIP